MTPSGLKCNVNSNWVSVLKLPNALKEIESRARNTSIRTT